MALAARSMNGTVTFAALVFMVAVSSWTGAMAQSSSTCTNVLISMSPCLSYIQGKSLTPSSSCCSQLANVVTSQPECLCEVINGGGSTSLLGINVNRTQAMAPPAACNVRTASQCNASSPSGTPLATPNSPSGGGGGGGGGSKTVPTTEDGTSAGRTPLWCPFGCCMYVTVLLSNRRKKGDFRMD